MSTSLLGIVLLGVGLYLAYKLVGALLKVVMLVVALVGGYWFAAPQMGWPTLPELIQNFIPEIGGQPVEEALDPANLARRATDHVVDGVLERTGLSGRGTDADAELPRPESPDDGESARDSPGR